MAIRPEQFVRAWRKTGGSPRAAAAALGISERRAYALRTKFEEDLGVPLKTGNVVKAMASGRKDSDVDLKSYIKRHVIDGFSGVCVVFSDCHYWPGDKPSVAHRALVKVVKEIRPKLLIANGDVFDGARMSKYPPNGWEATPKPSDELDEVKERMGEVRHACLRAQCLRTIGNHDIRFDRYLAMNASEIEGVLGTRLEDHLPAWKECMSIFINGHTMVKHRYTSGIHSTYNNTLRSGTNIVTGHTHLLEVKPWSDYRGRRYGVSTGAIADVDGDQFAYTEDNPTPWCSGFAVLTFEPSGKLLYPELCEVINGVAYFRGKPV